MAERETTNDTNSTTTDPSSTAVVTNELRCQLQPERFDGGAWYTATVALLEDVGIRDGDVEQKLKYVLIELPAFGSATVVGTNLVTPVNSPNELIVVHDRQWARNSYPRTIFLPSEYRPHLRLSGGRHGCHNLPGHQELAQTLDGKVVASVVYFGVYVHVYSFVQDDDIVTQINCL
jgi:hypothetical protein